MYKLVQTDKYKKKVVKFLKKHRNLISKYEKTIFLLEQNPFHPSLRLHKLKGDLKEFYSVSIDMEYRIIIDFIIIDDRIILIDIGSHDEVY
ncbi:type II toxin-antitoxin system mRNA interferase toxin, RelE/StbE family [Caminibacter mediatlanticus TB-2]|uniref:Type II toxin-antitoxin system mRNA interferase toxin, RelE/StbE family n=1 Tax=Caminibacter mediatlanticus TB-2 TaxID=391592 RepID=A0ABX5VB46_9BACT|nr:type II toxin-antitoxin system mRNA interferase toxin, RelE/StbE family [Caminibacter mediatlanticus]QCT94627.1 type II toxin-antitoxin system mRNA interferase toxin, RelE/StbE family [Caminibacter mediatlanticus TB-2]